jgi:RHS repeat-associated protein
MHQIPLILIFLYCLLGHAGMVSAKLADPVTVRDGVETVRTEQYTRLVHQATDVWDYDGRGNKLSDSIYDYAFDELDRLIIVQTNSAIPELHRVRLEFDYDTSHRRTEKRVYYRDGGQWELLNATKFVYAGWLLIAELDENDELFRSYTWGRDLSGGLQGAGGIGGLMSVTNHFAGTTWWPVYDGGGNVVAIVEAGEAPRVVATIDYGPFGQIVAVDAAPGSGLHRGNIAALFPFLFSTKYHDFEAELYYYGYRYYEPAAGKWLNRDPIAEQGGLNLYGFCQNDPVNAIDPLGLLWGLSYLHEWLVDNAARPVIDKTADVIGGTSGHYARIAGHTFANVSTTVVGGADSVRYMVNTYQGFTADYEANRDRGRSVGGAAVEAYLEANVLAKAPIGMYEGVTARGIGGVDHGMDLEWDDRVTRFAGGTATITLLGAPFAPRWAIGAKGNAVAPPAPATPAANSAGGGTSQGIASSQMTLQGPSMQVTTRLTTVPSSGMVAADTALSLTVRSGIPSVTGSRLPQLREATTFLRNEAGITSRAYRRQVIESFGSDLRVEVFQGQAYQYSGLGGTSSRYLATRPASNAVQELALPPSNPALTLQQYHVTTTRVLRGTASPQDFGYPLTGGAEQIFVPHRSVLTLSPLLPGP